MMPFPQLEARLRDRRVITALLVVAAGCMALFTLRERYFDVGQLLDSRIRGYSPDDIVTLFDRLGTNRRIYAITELSLDVIFPVAYAALLVSGLLWGFGRGTRLIILPVVAAIADFSENILIAWMAWTYPPLSTGLPALAAVLTKLKYLFFGTSLVALGAGTWRRVREWWPPVPGAWVPELKDVLREESDYIRLRRRHSKVAGDVADNLIGVALSGGGIRSATTCLGMLQAMSQMRILPLVDYLSTVSGGGYVGACLSSLLTWRHPNSIAPIFSTEWQTFPFNPNYREGRAQLDHLRTHGSFLVTRTGLLARETLRSIGHLATGTIYHLGVAILALSIVALLYLTGVMKVSPQLHQLLQADTPSRFLIDDPAYRAESPKETEREVFRDPTLFERLEHKAQLVRQAAWNSAFSRSPSTEALGNGGPSDFAPWLVIGAALYGSLLSICVFIAFYVYFSRGEHRHRGRAQPGESEHDAQERRLLRGVGVIGVFVTMATFAAARQLVPRFARAPAGLEGGADVLWLFVPALAMFATVATSLLIHVLMPRLQRAWHRTFRSLWGAFQALSWYAFLTALTFALLPLATYAFRDASFPTAMSGALSFVAARLLTSRVAAGRARWSLPTTLRKWLLGLAVAAGVFLILISITSSIVPADDATDVNAVSSAFLSGALVATSVLIIIGWGVDANRISPHLFYQDRLGETYLFTERREVSGVLDTGRNDTRLTLTTLHGPRAGFPDMTRGGTAPYHLISAAINLASSRDLTRKDRKSGYFLFSKYFCGSTHTGFARTACYGDGRFELGQAMTISGAAVSSAMGSSTFFAQAFATVLFNLRLGYWLPNPKLARTGSRKHAWHFWPRWLAREMFMRTSEHASLVNVSDGGHTGDNVGIYPLLQRRCRVIIACDAERDAGLTFGSITEALRHAYIDHGIEVDIDFTMVRPDPETGMSRSHCAVGIIRYPPLSRFGRQETLPSVGAGEPEDTELIGYLIYLKNSLTGDEPEAVLNYKADHPAFPHESTVDQFFDDAQFESYRALGAHIADTSLGAWVTEPDFETLRERHWPFRTAAARS